MYSLEYSTLHNANSVKLKKFWKNLLLALLLFSEPLCQTKECENNEYILNDMTEFYYILLHQNLKFNIKKLFNFQQRIL